VGLHGFADGTLIGGASHVGVSLRSAPSGDEAESPVAAVAAFESTALLESFVHGARPIVRLASGRGSAARRMNFTACGNAAVPEKHNTKGSATARILRRAEYIFISRPDLTHHRPPPAARFPMAVNGKLPKKRWNLDPGLKGKTKSGEQSHLKRFWNNYQRRVEFSVLNWRILICVKLGK